MDGTIDREERHRLIDMITAAWKTKVIGEAVGLGLIEALAAGRHDSAAIAQSLGADEDGVMRLLRALAVLGLVTHEGSDRFSLTPLGDCLRKDAPDSLYGMSGHWNERMWNSFANLGVSVMSGEPSVPSGPDHFVQQQADPARADVFNRAMAEGSLRVGRALARAYDFSDVKTVRDVGGGYGALLVGLLEAHPHLRGEIFDLATLGDAALKWQDGQPVRDRIAYLGGSFFDAVPPGADLLLLKFILHDWNDARCRTILSNCRDAIGDGRILIIERIVPDRVGPGDEDVIRGDLIMLSVGGKERTEAEYRALLSATGLDMTGITQIDDRYAAIEARRVG
ncbi:hypothetical protein M2333_000903 [Sphingobium sp. B11D3B]|uniref:acetylserotonin O-methyltransferase n=1 Tax=Sphingobium sp. B11D3B TaxID=2940575 RepID=UPI002227D786|nr:acetylserotonin O-methyltransferase [Sphingobium sp. B11D3B]MCW2387857.1 hypothetical protein [Sphingobium sp. B11D3B]